jgi:hypothetical protein
MVTDFRDEKPKKRKITEVGDHVNCSDAQIEIVGTFEGKVLGCLNGDIELIEVEGVTLE